MNKDRPNAFYAIMGISLVFMLACNSLSSLAPPTATATLAPTFTPTPIPDYDGTWEGTTSQDQSISISIENNEVVSLVVEIDMQGNGCTSNFEGTMGLSSSIEEGSFDITQDIYDGAITINGKFDSGQTVSGSLEYSQLAGCVGSVEIEWSATKGTSE
jgi:hypothetical protein